MKRAHQTIIIFLLVSSVFFGFSADVYSHNTPVTGTRGTDYAVDLINPVESIFLYDQLETSESRKEKALNEFVKSVADGQSDVIRGIFVDETVALPVSQQPAGQPAYVTSTDNLITEFSMPRRHGVFGFLAHNYLAGRYFYEIEMDDIIQVVYGDGQIMKYMVVDIQRYQALQPNSPRSEFIDLATSQRLSASQLFKRVYTGDHHITLQTCIQEGAVDTWGRLFIIAEPLA